MESSSNNKTTPNTSISTTTLPLENPMVSTAAAVPMVSTLAMSTGSLCRPNHTLAMEELRALRLADNDATNNRIENMSSALMRCMEIFQQHIESSVAWVLNEILNLSCAMQNFTNPMEN